MVTNNVCSLSRRLEQDIDTDLFKGDYIVMNNRTGALTVSWNQGLQGSGNDSSLSLSSRNAFSTGGTTCDSWGLRFADIDGDGIVLQVSCITLSKVVLQAKTITSASHEMETSPSASATAMVGLATTAQDSPQVSTSAAWVAETGSALLTLMEMVSREKAI